MKKIPYIDVIQLNKNPQVKITIVKHGPCREVFLQYFRINESMLFKFVLVFLIIKLSFISNSYSC